MFEEFCPGVLLAQPLIFFAISVYSVQYIFLAQNTFKPFFWRNLESICDNSLPADMTARRSPPHAPASSSAEGGRKGRGSGRHRLKSEQEQTFIKYIWQKTLHIEHKKLNCIPCIANGKVCDCTGRNTLPAQNQRILFVSIYLVQLFSSINFHQTYLQCNSRTTGFSTLERWKEKNENVKTLHVMFCLHFCGGPSPLLFLRGGVSPLQVQKQQKEEKYCLRTRKFRDN